mmetsp:Transcript_3097/g.9001  ORF Transcript_3097/g.9001 Transcript_3097/m.9001 type:complete len:276 (-) Transcript_3097:467-1294(-)
MLALTFECSLVTSAKLAESRLVASCNRRISTMVSLANSCSSADSDTTILPRAPPKEDLFPHCEMAEARLTKLTALATEDLRLAADIRRRNEGLALTKLSRSCIEPLLAMASAFVEESLLLLLVELLDRLLIPELDDLDFPLPRATPNSDTDSRPSSGMSNWVVNFRLDFRVTSIGFSSPETVVTVVTVPRLTGATAGGGMCTPGTGLPTTSRAWSSQSSWTYGTTTSFTVSTTSYSLCLSKRLTVTAALTTSSPGAPTMKSMLNCSAILCVCFAT